MTIDLYALHAVLEIPKKSVAGDRGVVIASIRRRRRKNLIGKMAEREKDRRERESEIRRILSCVGNNYQTDTKSRDVWPPAFIRILFFFNFKMKP